MALLLTQAAFPQGGDPPPPPDGKDFYIRVFLQGLYIGDEVMRQVHEERPAPEGIVPRWMAPIAEKLTVEIHTPGNYGQSGHVWARNQVNLNQDGWITVNLPETGSYYLTIRTRNHLETVSANAINFTNPTRVYDFTTAASQAYGDNQVDLGGGVFGIYAGDVDQDGILTGADLVSTTDQIRLTAVGYLVEDVDGDGIMTGADLALITDNVRLTITAQTPD